MAEEVWHQTLLDGSPENDSTTQGTMLDDLVGAITQVG